MIQIELDTENSFSLSRIRTWKRVKPSSRQRSGKEMEDPPVARPISAAVGAPS